MGRDDGSLYEWEMVDYWYEKGGLQKLESQYPELFCATCTLRYLMEQHWQHEQGLKKSVERAIAEKFNEPY